MGKPRLDLLEHVQILAADARLIHRYAREIATRLRQAGDQALADRVSDADEHDWNRVGLLLKGSGGGSRKGEDHVRMQSD